MTDQSEDGWSTPSLYSGGNAVIEPRTFTEADPISQAVSYTHLTLPTTPYV